MNHKTVLQVDGEGTEASAATSLGVGGISAAPLSLTVDRPVVVAIREHHSGTILFPGTVMDPTAGETRTFVVPALPSTTLREAGRRPRGPPRVARWDAAPPRP
ncbi:serpin family protein [Salinibacter pepae]